MELTWNWEFALTILPRLLTATLSTLAAAAIGYAIALVGGLILALLQMSKVAAVRVVAREIVEFLRSTPLLLQIFFVFYVGPQFGITLSPWVAGMLAIGLYYSAYLSEVYRGAIAAVPSGQWEAITALSLPRVTAFRRIIAPQALPTALAGMGNYLVSILKDTPMLSVIGVAELMQVANSIGAESYRFLEPYTLVGLIFLILSLPTAYAIKSFEKWVRKAVGVE